MIRWLYESGAVPERRQNTSRPDTSDIPLSNLQLLEQVEMTTPVVVKNFPKIVDNKGDCLLRENQFVEPPSCKFEEADLQAGYAESNVSSFDKSPCGKKCGPNRGSSKPSQKTVKEWKKDELDPGYAKMGCGNPICVLLDRRPVRFHSLCHFNREVAARGAQVNYIQKGECYDIMDRSGTTNDQPWVAEEPALQDKDCQSCSFNEDCNKKITFNVDLLSIIYGKSSAFGGKDYNPERKTRMPGVPLEFPNVCMAMLFFQENKNLNFKTQLVGYALGSKKEIYPRDGDACVWTEWFDHNTPCYGKGDLEVHREHQAFLENSYTGDSRICSAKSIKETQQQGGSEVTNLPAKECQEGKGRGSLSTKDARATFRQELKITPTSIQCDNDQQPLESLPAPFIFAEDLGVKCLDYKQRYCCNSVDMFRPLSITEFSRFMEAMVPIGPTLVRVKWSEDMKEVDGIKFTIKNTNMVIDKTDKSQNCIKMELTSLKGIDKIREKRIKQKFTGKIILSEDYIVDIHGVLYHEDIPNGEKKIDIKVQ